MFGSTFLVSYLYLETLVKATESCAEKQKTEKLQASELELTPILSATKIRRRKTTKKSTSVKRLRYKSDSERYEAVSSLSCDNDYKPPETD